MHQVELNIVGAEGSSDGLSTAEAQRRLEQYGYNEIKDRSKKWYELLWAQVWGDHWYPNSIPAMMWIAIIVSLAIEDWIDAGVVLALHSFNSGLGFYETLKAGDAVAALKEALAPQCNCKRDGQWVKMMARELVPGDLIILKIGDVVPADGTLMEGGTCDLDQSGLTGESLPVKKVPGDTCYSGTVVKRGEQDMYVTKTGEMTEMGKSVALIQSVESKGQVEVIMNKITLVLLIFALVFNTLLLIVELVDDSILLLCETDPLNDGCEKNKARKILANLVVLVISTIPIATPVVVTATMAIGARRMAQASAVVTRLSAIEELAGMTVLCSDKTGTLTKNVLTIDDPVLMGAPDRDTLVFKAALSAKSVDPDAIDKCVRENVVNPAALQDYVELDFLPFDPVIKRTEATIRGPDGKEFRVSKGAPQVILDMAYNTEEIKQQVDDAVVAFADRGLRPIGVAECTDGENWIFLGLISLFDPPRDDTQDTIERALALGSEVKMVTGDHLLIAKETCRRLGMGTAILKSDSLDQPRERLLELVEGVDGFAEVFPEHKFDIVALYQENGHITGMTGDGVNDAPALRKANVGFAVEGATPAAQGAASVILLTPGLSVIITAIVRSRKIFQRLQNYLTYRIFLSVFLLTFFFAAIVWAKLNFPTAIIIVMCVVFDLATMSLAYDKVFPSPKPNKWNLPRIIMVSSILGVVGVAGNLAYLAFLRDNAFGLSVAQRGHSTPCSFGYFLDNGGSCVKYNCGNPTLADGSINPDFTFPSCLTPAQHTKFFDAFNAAGSKVPGSFTLATDDPNWIVEHHPYSQALENTAIFLTLSLTAQFGVFITRVEGFFWTRRPGYVLLAIMFGEMAAITISCYTIRDYQFWVPDVPSGSYYIRLTGVAGAYIGAGYLWAIVVAMMMELVKILAYKAYDYKDLKTLRRETRLQAQNDNRRRVTMAENRRRLTLDTSMPRRQTTTSIRSRVATSSGAAAKGGAMSDLKQPLLTGDAY